MGRFLPFVELKIASTVQKLKEENPLIRTLVSGCASTFFRRFRLHEKLEKRNNFVNLDKLFLNLLFIFLLVSEFKMPDLWTGSTIRPCCRRYWNLVPVQEFFWERALKIELISITLAMIVKSRVVHFRMQASLWPLFCKSSGRPPFHHILNFNFFPTILRSAFFWKKKMQYDLLWVSRRLLGVSRLFHFLVNDRYFILEVFYEKISEKELFRWFQKMWQFENIHLGTSDFQLLETCLSSNKSSQKWKSSFLFQFQCFLVKYVYSRNKSRFFEVFLWAWSLFCWAVGSKSIQIFHWNIERPKSIVPFGLATIREYKLFRYIFLPWDNWKSSCFYFFWSLFVNRKPIPRKLKPKAAQVRHRHHRDFPLFPLLTSCWDQELFVSFLTTERDNQTFYWHFQILSFFFRLRQLKLPNTRIFDHCNKEPPNNFVFFESEASSINFQQHNNPDRDLLAIWKFCERFFIDTGRKDWNWS